jgi:hypothetical protein
MGFAQGSQAVLFLCQVINGTEQQDRIDGLTGWFEPACISDRDRSQRMLRLLRRCSAGLLDVTGHGIDQMHLVPARGQPAGIGSSSAADIEHPGGRGRNVAEDQFLRARSSWNHPVRRREASSASV